MQTDMTKYSLPEPDDEGVGTGTGWRKRRVDRRPSFRSISKRFIETAQQARAENRFCRSLPLAYPGRLDLDCRRLSRMPHANRNVSVAPCSDRANAPTSSSCSQSKETSCRNDHPRSRTSEVEDRARSKKAQWRGGGGTTRHAESNFFLSSFRLSTGS